MPAPSSRPFLQRRIARPGTALATALVIAALTSCSSGSDPSSDAAGTSLADGTQAPPTPTSESTTSPSSQAAPSSTTLRATEVDFAIELPQRELAAGSYTIEVANEGDATHDLVIEDASGAEVAASEIIPPGGTGTVEVDLEPGEYVFYCSVGNHRGMGMELAVTVS